MTKSTPNVKAPFAAKMPMPGTDGNASLDAKPVGEERRLPRAKRKEDGSSTNFAHWLFDNQTGVSFSIIALLYLANAYLPQARPYTSKVFNLSYYNPNTGKYAIGYDDFCLIGLFIVLFTGLRAASMRYLLTPLALWIGSPPKKATRFAEQGWILMYYSVFWPLGMYIYMKSPYFMSMKALWEDWPERELDGLKKAYLLAQWSYWSHQVLAVNMEARRKDYAEIMVHHFLTITLIAASYFYHFTRVGNLILVSMDLIELIFPLAKCLKYLDFTTLCDAVFAVFAVTWILTRHVLYLSICWSVYYDVPRTIDTACYLGRADDIQGPFPVPEGWSHLLQPFRDPAGLICFDRTVWISFISYLLMLQAIMSVWTFFLIRVIVRVLKGDNAEDVRSDEELEEGNEHEAIEEEDDPQPIEEEVGVEAIDLKAWERRTGMKRAAASTSVRLPGQSDQKEFLNRIGCEHKIE